MNRVIALVLLATIPLEASAETVITRGQFLDSQDTASWVFDFGYQGVTYTGGDEAGLVGGPALGARPIGPAVFGGGFDGLDMGGTYTAGGVTTNVFYGTVFVGYNPSVSMGSSTIDITGPGTFLGTFTFGGALCAYADGTHFPNQGPAVPCLNTGGAPLQIMGSGTVELTAVALPGYPGSVDVTSVKYTFAPEPGSFGLLVIGLAGMGALALQRRRVAGTEPRVEYTALQA